MLQTGTNYKISQEKRRKYPSNIAYYDASARQSAYELKEGLVKLFRSHHIQSRELVIMCIGSDRSTGDSLGPLIGYKLEKFHIPGISVRGTLSEPVHAANLAENLERVNSSYRHPFVLAVDASLGTHEHIGYVTLSEGPLRPGLGVKEELPDVGDIHITGIVNFSGMMESLLLQTTRLSMVMQLADVISKAILYGITEYYEM